jgi:hypothetical protein
MLLLGALDRRDWIVRLLGVILSVRSLVSCVGKQVAQGGMPKIYYKVLAEPMSKSPKPYHNR